MPTRHNGETEARLQYEAGLATGSEHAKKLPPLVKLDPAREAHMLSLKHYIDFGPYERDYRAGFTTGWARARVSR